MIFFRKERVRFLRTPDISKLNATLKIEGNIVERFQESMLNYAEKYRTNEPVYQPQDEFKFILRKTKNLISLIEWEEKNLDINISQGVIKARIRGDYFIVKARGKDEFIEYIYQLIRKDP